MECTYVNCFSLRWIVKIERGTLGSQFTEQQQGSSSALLRAEGEKELSLYLRLSACRLSCKPYQFVGIHSYLSYMALSVFHFHCQCILFNLRLSLELSAAPCQRKAVNWSTEHGVQAPLGHFSQSLLCQPVRQTCSNSIFLCSPESQFPKHI